MPYQHDQCHRAQRLTCSSCVRSCCIARVHSSSVQPQRCSLLDTEHTSGCIRACHSTTHSDNQSGDTLSARNRFSENRHLHRISPPIGEVESTHPHSTMPHMVSSCKDNKRYSEMMQLSYSDADMRHSCACCCSCLLLHRRNAAAAALVGSRRPATARTSVSTAADSRSTKNLLQSCLPHLSSIVMLPLTPI